MALKAFTNQQRLVFEMLKASAVIIHHAKKNKLLNDDLFLTTWADPNNRGELGGFQSGVILTTHDLINEVTFWRSAGAEWCLEFLGFELITPPEFLQKLLENINKSKQPKAK